MRLDTVQRVPCREGGWMWGQIQSPLSLQQSISSCISRKAKAGSKGNGLLHFRISLSDKLIYTLRWRWAAMCHGGLRVCRIHSNQRHCWWTSLISFPSLADRVLISDIYCYITLDWINSLEHYYTTPFLWIWWSDLAPGLRRHTGLM